jgi:hypothetical protein
MRFFKYPIVIALTVLFASWSVWAQDREVEIHKNVRLVITAASSDIPAGIAGQYQVFLPLLESVIKENVPDQSDECALTFRVIPIIKEIGAAKTKRAAARITAFRRNSKQEFFGNLILYSYVNSGPVNKEETQDFLMKQILQPAECRKE